MANTLTSEHITNFIGNIAKVSHHGGMIEVKKTDLMTDYVAAKCSPCESALLGEGTLKILSVTMNYNLKGAKHVLVDVLRDLKGQICFSDQVLHMLTVVDT